MFVKLLKYELKATSRTFLPLYGGLFVLAVITKLFMVLGSRFPHNFAISIPSALTMFLFMVALIAAFALTFFCLLQRFYKNMTGDEAYFMVHPAGEGAASYFFQAFVGPSLDGGNRFGGRGGLPYFNPWPGRVFLDFVHVFRPSGRNRLALYP